MLNIRNSKTLHLRIPSLSTQCLHGRWLTSVSTVESSSRKQPPIMSRTLRKAVESAKQKRETELRLPDEGIANLEDVPELCK